MESTQHPEDSLEVGEQGGLNLMLHLLDGEFSCLVGE